LTCGIAAIPNCIQQSRPSLQIDFHPSIAALRI
jgi:hypothetical protein